MERLLSVILLPEVSSVMYFSRLNCWRRIQSVILTIAFPSSRPGMGSYNFLDTDQIIERVTGMSIPEIFDAEGEEGFRKVETQVLDSVHSYVRCVVSTGGGLVTKMENWSKLQSGIVVWVDVDPEVIFKRIEGTDRPLLQCNDPLRKLKDLLEERKDKYSQADLTVKVTEDMDPDAVADKLVRDMHDFIDENPPAWKLAKQKAQAEGLDWVQ